MIRAQSVFIFRPQIYFNETQKEKKTFCDDFKQKQAKTKFIWSLSQESETACQKSLLRLVNKLVKSLAFTKLEGGLWGSTFFNPSLKYSSAKTLEWYWELLQIKKM